MEDLKVDEKAMMKNQCNPIPHPSPDNKRERLIYKQVRGKTCSVKQHKQKLKVKRTAVSQQMATRLAETKQTKSQRQTESG